MIELERALDKAYEVLPYFTSTETTKAINHAQQLLHQLQVAHQQGLKRLSVTAKGAELEEHRGNNTPYQSSPYYHILSLMTYLF